MQDDALTDGYISAFLRDALRIGASTWIVGNVTRIWLQHGVPLSALLAAIDEVGSEPIADPDRLALYQRAVREVAAGRGDVSLIPTQRAGEAETHAVDICCRTCEDSYRMDGDDVTLNVDLAAFASRHFPCPPFAVQTTTLR